jgi:hypothetical protein
MAKDADTSNCAASAAQEIKNAAPTIPIPKMNASKIGWKWRPPKTIVTDGTPRHAKAASRIQEAE